ANAIRPALHPVDHAIREELVAGQLVIRAYIEDIDVALVTRAGVARPLAGADDVELLVVGREAETVRIRDLFLGHDHIDLIAARVPSVALGRQLPLERAHAGR